MFMHIIKHLLAHSINEPMKPKIEPNKALEPRRLLVTDRACARSAPSNRLAQL